MHVQAHLLTSQHTNTPRGLTFGGYATRLLAVRGTLAAAVGREASPFA